VELPLLLCFGGHNLLPVHPETGCPAENAAIERHPKALTAVREACGAFVAFISQGCFHLGQGLAQLTVI